MHAPRSIASLLVSTIALAGCGSTADQRGDVVATTSTTDASVTTAQGGVLVDVAGRVRRPGVYRLAAGARVHEAIAAAGGAKRGADLASLNRAAALVDGQQVLVGVAGVDVPTGSSGAGGSVSINRADVEELDALPGIGPVTAQRIVTEREQSGPYASVDDLDRVPGIGPGTIDALRELATT